MLAITRYLDPYQSLFVGRSDDYAIQLSTGRYRRVGKPLTKAEVFDHLIGRHTCGTYVMDAEGCCRFAVIDADMDDGLDRLWQIQDQLATQGIVSSVEQSRRGGHLWIFFTRPTPAAVPSHTTSFSFKSGRTNGVSSIREWNASQDYYQVISRHVSLNEKGVGKCPFGDHHTGGQDRQASFKVYEPGVPGGYCWYCYTWQKGGSLFDFLKYYYRLSTQELWERIQAEEI